LGEAVPDLRFDSTVPVEVQLNDYSCSVGATFWCLRSLGVSITQQDLENAMVPTLVSPLLGLLDGGGATIVNLLQQRFGLSARNTSPVTFDDVAAGAGKQPIALGGSRWLVGADGSVTGHWVAVRSFDGTQLILANPGGTGPNFGQHVLTRDDFAQRGPFAAVWIDAAASTTSFIPNGSVGNTGGQGANLRSQPSTDASVVGTLPDGRWVSSATHAWRAVTDATSIQGWIANEYLTSANGAFQVANTGGTGANLRSQPGTDSSSIKLLADGTALTGDAHAWRQITDASGTSGWVADDLLVPILDM
jgi:SH3-like domain-containing protein